MTGKLKMLSAGAGAGKTHRLSDEILTSIQNGVPPENIMATTFTTKAASELIERIRLKLLESGDSRSAARILDGYVGTMNSVFGRLLREFSLELGLSPVQKVLAETEATSLFNIIAAEVIDRFYGDYRDVFLRLSLDDFNDNDWKKSVLTIIKLARENGMNPDEVKACADYSWKNMSEWLPEALKNPKEQEEALKSALNVAKSHLPGDDTTKKTKDTLEIIHQATSYWDKNGFLTWQQWAKLSKLDAGKDSKDAVSPILSAASVHYSHPLLHQDLKNAIEAVFHCAAEAMGLYAEEKSKRGLIDFTDQEALALDLLKNEEHLEALRDRISDVFVDEFQDVNPLQIALNMRLREVADKATWVGDVKQAIYGFRGTDPELMQTAMASNLNMEVEILDSSYRSRESLVTFVNDIFVPVFEARGMEEEQIKLKPMRKDMPEQAIAVEAWSYHIPKKEKKKKGSESEQKPKTPEPKDPDFIALGVQKVLAEKEKYVIVDKTTREQRTLRAGDIAILCRANAECGKVAEALSKVGIPATVGEVGLLAKPEAIFAKAAMRYLVDSYDTLALAELIHFSSEKWGEGKWLNAWLDPEKKAKIIADVPIIQELDKDRKNIDQMSPSEVLDLALIAAKADEVTIQWGSGDQRLANLDALRKLATKYEETAETNGTAATTSGFLLFLVNAEKNDELNQVAESTDENAVRVLTYHKAKGLEWPFVIVNSLEKTSSGRKSPVFGSVNAVSTKGFNVEDPLHGRRLYFWPWPYGKQSSNVVLDEFAEDTQEFKQKQKQLIDENQRLLYVGMTRARDYLVFTARDFSKAGWLEELTDEFGNHVISSLGVVEAGQEDASLDDRVGKIQIKDQQYPCRLRVLAFEEGAIEVIQSDTAEKFVYVGKTIEAEAFEPARFSPSGQKLEEGGQFVQEMDASSKIHCLGRRLPLTGNPEMDLLGDMVHGFLAADNHSAEKETRLGMASAIRERYGISAISEESMLEASERLEQFIYNQYPDLIKKHSEWPIHLRKGMQKASGWIDLLLLTPKGWVIIDHKTFPGREEAWLSKAISYLPQLQVYAEALTKATGKPVYEAWIHMPVVGAIINFTEEELK